MVRVPAWPLTSRSRCHMLVPVSKKGPLTAYQRRRCGRSVAPGRGAGPMEPVRIVLADDVEDIRYLFRVVLEAAGRFEVVGEAATGREAVDLARSLQPDVILLDLGMPEMGGLEALPLIKVASPTTQVA